MSILRQMWPKKPVRSTADHPARVQAVIASIRSGELTVTQGSRELGCVRKTLAERVWQETKQGVLARDGMCVVCLTNNSLDVQHRIARGSGGSSRPKILYGWANLVTLCRTDHMYVEAHPDWARDAGLRLDRSQTPAVERVTYCGRWALLGDDGSVRYVPYRGKEHL